MRLRTTMVVVAVVGIVTGVGNDPYGLAVIRR